MPGMAAEGWPRGSDKDRATGLHPWSVMFYPQGCCYHLCSCGPLSAAGKGTGKACWRVESPSSHSLCPATFPLSAVPSHSVGRQQGATARSGDAGISRGDIGPRRRAPD